MNNKDTPMYSGNSKGLKALQGTRGKDQTNFCIIQYMLTEYFFTNQTFIKNILKPKSYFMGASAGFSIIALELCL